MHSMNKKWRISITIDFSQPWSHDVLSSTLNQRYWILAETTVGEGEALRAGPESKEPRNASFFLIFLE